MRPDDAALELLDEVFRDYGPIDFRIRLWNDRSWPARAPAEPRFTVAFHRPGALRRMLRSRGDLHLSEAFVYGDISVGGELAGVYRLRDYLEVLPVGPHRLARLAWLWPRLPRDDGAPTAATTRPPARLGGQRHSVDRDRQAVSFHYDVSNDFYATWLDRRMVYSCAYFPTGQEDLDKAQEAKLDHICRKLQLRPGQRLLDIGCGWGGLVMHAAERYGVHAVGITLASRQHELAQERIRSAGLGDRCKVELRDYRDVHAERFDKIVSVGMFEHVGERNFGPYFGSAFRSLKPGGLFLNHAIGVSAAETRARSEFAQRYVFPDGELRAIGPVLKRAELAGFEVLDVESLRPHYALTLRHWVRRLEENRAAALQCVDAPTFRVWQLYMTGAAYYFDIGRLTVYQALLAKPTADGRSVAPWSRAHLYT